MSQSFRPLVTAWHLSSGDYIETKESCYRVTKEPNVSIGRDSFKIAVV